MPPNEKQTQRRWYQLSLPGILWLLLTIAIAVFGIREHRERLRMEQELQELRSAIATKDLRIARTERAAAELQKYSDAMTIERARQTHLEYKATLDSVSSQLSTQTDPK